MITEQQAGDLRYALNVYARIVNSPAARETLTPQEKLFLLTIGTYNAPQDTWVGAKELGKIYGHNSQSASRILSDLEAKGLLTRVEGSDRREQKAVLTEKGVGAYERLVQCLDRMARENPIDNRNFHPSFL